MLNTIKLDSWSELEKRIERQLLQETQEQVYHSCYRGHANADWRLETTLERAMGPDQDVGEYYMSMERIQSELEAFTDRDWDLPTFPNHADITVDTMRDVLYQSGDYMKYLRHFGYPSPLLDWTLSPFVAAYFAFRDITNKAESVAIYELMMTSDMGQSPRIGEPHIYPVYGSSRRNKRHYLQQSFYTVCLKSDKNRICFASHEDPSAMGSEGGYSGEPMAKFILPASERITALHSLEAYNINAYSLIGTEESLLESLFLRDYKNKAISKRIFPDEY